MLYYMRPRCDGAQERSIVKWLDGLPLLVRACALNSLAESGLVLVGIAVTNVCFVLSAITLDRLGGRLLDRRLARRAALLYCVSPASIFHCTVYTESPFALATFGGVLVVRKRSERTSGRRTNDEQMQFVIFSWFSSWATYLKLYLIL